MSERQEKQEVSQGGRGQSLGEEKDPELHGDHGVDRYVEHPSPGLRSHC